MERRRIEGTRHVRRRMKPGARIAIAALSIALVAVAGILICKKLDPDKYSLKAVASRVESAFKGAAPEGSVVAINTSATTKPDGTPMGYVSGGGTLINRATGGGNTLTLTASESGDNLFNGWTVNGTRIGSMDTTLKVCINTSAHDKQYYDSTTKTLYVTDTADIKAVYIAPLMAPANEQSRVGLYITPNTGHCWIDNIDGHPETWDGYLIIPGGHQGTSARLILQYVDGDSARAYVYDNSMSQISTGTGHRSDTKDLYVDFTIPDVDKWTTIYCVPRLNQTDNSCFAIFEPNPADAGSCGGTMTSGNSPFTTQLQATPNKGYKLKDWTVVFDGDTKTLTDKNPSVYINGTYKIIANFEEAYYDVKLAKTEPSDGGSVTGLDKYKEGSSPDISITCNDGYKLDNWSYTTTDGIVHSGTNENFTISNIKEDIELYVTFKSEKKRINIKSSPASGGYVKIQNTSVSDPIDKDDYEDFIAGERAAIWAKANERYKFLYWKDSKDNTYRDDNIGFEVTFDDTYTAYFARETVNIKTEVYPNDGGTVTLDYNPDDSGTFKKSSSKLGDHTDVEANKRIHLKAVNNTNYRFVEFVDSKGNRFSNDIDIPETSVLDDETYTAVFAGNTFKIDIKSDPVVLGVKLLIDGVEQTTKDNIPFEDTAEHKINVTIPTGAGYKFLYWEDSRGRRYQEGLTPEMTVPTNAGDLSYTAHLVKDPVKVTLDVSPANSGTLKLNSETAVGTKTSYDVAGNSTITLTPDGSSKYDLVQVIDNYGKTYTPSSGVITIPNVDNDISFTAVFSDKKYSISIDENPAQGGTATVNGKYGSDEVKADDSFTLEAIPAHGYIFDKWTEEGDETALPVTGTKYTGTATSNRKYIAHFVKQDLDVEVKISPSGYGSVMLYGQERTSTNKTYKVSGNSTVTVMAYPAAGKKFVRWDVTDKTKGATTIYTDNPLVTYDVIHNMVFDAHFEDQQSTISVAVNPADGSGGTATVNGDISPATLNNGEPALLRATPKDGYIFLYWTSSDGTQYDGRRGLDGGSTLTIDKVYKTDTYTAHFVKKDLTILLESSPAGVGMVRLGNNSYEDDKVQYTVTGNSSIQIFAEPKDPSKYKFERWENKNNSSEVYTTNPATIVSVADTMHYVAVFVPKNLGISTVASPASGGKVTKTINDDGSVTITASANRGYSFANWKKGDKLLTTGVKYVIDAEDVKDGDVYTAYFKTNKDYDAKSDITKENFYREWRKVYDPSYKVTRETMQQQARFVVSNLRQYNDATPPLRNFAAFAEAREYYESLLSDADIKRMRGRFGDSELITAEGEILKPDLLPDYEVYEDKAEAFTLKKFGDRYDTEILTVKRVYEPEDFNNINRTYLWRYTGAQFKDNIYLLYNIDGKEEAWATPIVDEDDVIKFTLDELPDNDVLAVVRVKIK